MIQCREATEADIPVIQRIAKITWGPTYVPIIGQAQVDYMLSTMYSTTILGGQIADGQRFLILMIDGKDVGFAGFGSEDLPEAIYKLHKLYLLPEVQGRGLGKFLIQTVMEQVKQAGAAVLLLNVNRANPALHFYQKLGFKIKETVDIEIGNGFFMNDYILEISIS